MSHAAPHTESSHKPLAGKTAIITGASSGIGRATALAFAQAGANVLITARREARLEEVRDAVEQAGGRCRFVAGDAAVENTALEAADLALSTFGSIDILIANAGAGNYKQLVDTSVEDYDALMDANMKSSFLFARHCAPHMIAQRSGSILFISSVAGLVGTANEAVYSAAKFAQVGFAQALDAELRPHNIKVGVVCPGGVKTEFAVGHGRTEEAVQNGYMMDAAEVAETLLFACTLPPNVRIPQMIVRHMGGAAPK